MQFSEYAGQNFTATAPINGRPDPFNYPMPGRTDCMSLSTINDKMDNMKTTTVKFQSYRGTSQNLATNDIFGKLLLFKINFH